MNRQGSRGRIDFRPVNFCIQPASRPINTAMIKVLPVPVDSALAWSGTLS
jgi:hypothetical protein